MAAVRLLPFRREAGPWQMAADEVLLERAEAGVSSLRFYAWEPATVSLGYFQKHEERLADAALAAYPWVRRCTGGGAIIHDHDLTYAFALSPVARAGLPAAEWHQRFHEALVSVLQQRQIAAELAAGPRPAAHALPYACFAVPQPGDVLLAGKKIIGGAQRLRHGALMQHGSIQLPAVQKAAHVLAAAVADTLDWQLDSSDWSAEEMARIEGLAQAKYGDEAWNKKR